MPIRVTNDPTSPGSLEALFFSVPASGETDRILWTARTLGVGRKLKRAARAKSRSLGVAERLITSMTSGALRVLEELLTLARLTRGRAPVTGLGRAAIVRAIACLEAVGFLVRQRWFVPVPGEGGGAALRPGLQRVSPAAAGHVRRLLPRWMRTAPIPPCEAQRQADREAEQAAMLATLSCREIAAVTADSALGRMLAQLGAALDARECESHNYAQSIIPFCIRGGEARAAAHGS